MRLLGKQLLMLVTDGAEQEEIDQLRAGFEREQATVLLTSPHEYPTVETVVQARRGKDIPIDLPFEAVGELEFDGLVIPDGALSVDMLRRDGRVATLVKEFHERGLPIFASGAAVQLLYDCGVLSNQILVREGTPMASFLDRAVGLLLDGPLAAQLYRSTS